MFNFFHMSPFYFYCAIGILGLLVGSFLNVVATRLPIILHRQWQEECRELLKLLPDKHLGSYNLATPRSHCPHCHHPIKPQHNIPIISFLWLRGQCAYCKRAIRWRYPLLEFASMALALICVWHFGITIQTVAALIFTWALLALAVIDLEQQILPDMITLPLLWLGLLLSTQSIFVDMHSAIWGAAGGYLVLWLLAWAFHRITGKTGMGQGDFKLLALIGAWVGWQILPFVILLASVLGSAVGLTLLALKRQHRNTPIAFGPYLALAGWLALLWNEKFLLFYWQMIY